MNHGNIHSPRSTADDRHGSSRTAEKKKDSGNWTRYAKKRQRPAGNANRPETTTRSEHEPGNDGPDGLPDWVYE